MHTRSIPAVLFAANGGSHCLDGALLSNKSRSKLILERPLLELFFFSLHAEFVNENMYSVLSGNQSNRGALWPHRSRAVRSAVCSASAHSRPVAGPPRCARRHWPRRAGAPRRSPSRRRSQRSEVQSTRATSPDVKEMD